MAISDWRIELVFVPVSDVDAALDFYQRIGWHLDHDQRPSEALRFVQMTPPGSACSIAFGEGLRPEALEPGSMSPVQLVIPDADAALEPLRGVGVDADGVDEQPWGRFVTFADPDGNGWTLQQLPEWTRQPNP
jgi:catechol 2,3-dioxygenase-like lactoylglutathione lyase family enzyme